MAFKLSKFFHWCHKQKSTIGKKTNKQNKQTNKQKQKKKKTKFPRLIQHKLLYSNETGTNHHG